MKITVIATRFKDSDVRRRQQEQRAGFVVSHEPKPDPDFETTIDPGPPPPRMVMEQAALQPPAPVEAVAVETMRNAMIANFEKEDLDVPAFLRRRGEVI